MTAVQIGEVRGEMPLERIEAELTELAGQLAGGECRWLLLVGEYDRREGYQQWGCRSCAQWLGWQCGLDGRAAREKLRVARAIDDLPLVTQAFAAGRLSYSKVRALTRIATPDNQADLVELAEHATAVHVERIVRGFRRAKRAHDERDETERQHAERFLRIEIDEDDSGSYVVNGRIPADVAAAILTALEAARALVPRPESDDDATEGGSAEPLVHAALNDRHMVTVSVDATVLDGDDPDGVCEIDGGTRLAPETARRLMCDSSVVWMLQDDDGKPVNVSPVPAASLRPCAGRCTRGIGVATSPGVASVRPPTSTTSAIAPTAVTTRWSTWPSCAGTIIASSTKAAGACAVASTDT
jgi:hypothetical protein